MTTRYYFVDEAGDSTLFTQKGRSLIGTNGCSKYFMVGMLDVQEPVALAHDLETLRLKLVTDPYFRSVPSMQPQARKTHLFFHAKDDVAEVRHEVFALLRSQKLRFFAVVRDKTRVLEYVRQKNSNEPEYHYDPNELYDSLVRRLFKNLLHKDDAYHIYFARRGASDRTAALHSALLAARQRFERQWNVKSTAPISVSACLPPEHGGFTSRRLLPLGVTASV